MEHAPGDPHRTGWLDVHLPKHRLHFTEMQQMFRQALSKRGVRCSSRAELTKGISVPAEIGAGGQYDQYGQRFFDPTPPSEGQRSSDSSARCGLHTGAGDVAQFHAALRGVLGPRIHPLPKCDCDPCLDYHLGGSDGSSVGIVGDAPSLLVLGPVSHSRARPRSFHRRTQYGPRRSGFKARRSDP